ncbi:hypothetical protein TSUD_02640 [Trifolium subterraneum]|uniref:Leucine-rich repeat-containing N-terminal plant-type domain-containing protein n=1 Tax=Trifolium subterraneum TaxID=3900 RepID=A0A2Z6MNP7_TRISU|nr:hypothetical protein TSUD_02640 [Trifolium subterraneum]
MKEEAQALLAFKNGADVNNMLMYTTNNYCQWEGVQCINGSVVKYQIQHLNLQDLSPLTNLKSLFLSQNNFSGSFPPSILILKRLVALSLSSNNFSDTLPFELNDLKNLLSLNLSFNHFSGSFPPLNQAHLKVLDVSNNNFSGALPNTETLSHFKPASFSNNSYLCGEIIHKECPYHHHHHNHGLRIALIVFFATICIAICAILVIKKNKSGGESSTRFDQGRAASGDTATSTKHVQVATVVVSPLTI